MLRNWDTCYKATREYEGGNDDDPRDPGGRTSRGITQREYDVYRKTHPDLPEDVWLAPESAITDIYKTKYWNLVSGDNWPDGCDMSVWDATVLCGPGKSKAWSIACMPLAASITFLGLAKRCMSEDKIKFIHAFAAKRSSFLHALKTFVTFGRGWSNRDAKCEALSAKMAMDAAGVYPANQKTILESKAKDAAASSKTGRIGSIVATAGSSATVANAHPNTLFDFFMFGGFSIFMAVMVAFAVWQWHVGKVRSKELLEVAAKI